MQMTESYRHGMEIKVAEREKQQQLNALAALALAAAAAANPSDPDNPHLEPESILHNRFNAPKVASTTPGKMDHASVVAYQVGAHTGPSVTLLPQNLSVHNSSHRGMRSHARSSVGSAPVSGSNAIMGSCAGRSGGLPTIDASVLSGMLGSLSGVGGGAAASATAGHAAPPHRLPLRSSTARSVVVPQSFT